MGQTRKEELAQQKIGVIRKWIAPISLILTQTLRLHLPCYFTAIASISTFAPIGRAAT